MNFGRSITPTSTRPLTRLVGVGHTEICHEAVAIYFRNYNLIASFPVSPICFNACEKSALKQIGETGDEATFELRTSQREIHIATRHDNEDQE